MNNENLKPVQELTPFTKMIMTIGTLPTSFYASMSYYESMVWLYEYLKNQVIPAVNNNAEAVEELQAKYNEFTENINEKVDELETYMNDYFTNLDVQQEINNKLDEMALDGTLTTLISNYVNPIYEAYETQIDERVNGQDTEITNFKNTVNDQISVINTKVNNATSGSPLVATSTSEMTDTTKVYVNTTDGNWYYYDGDSWEIGGVYLSNDEGAIELVQEELGYKYTDFATQSTTSSVKDIRITGSFEENDYVEINLLTTDTHVTNYNILLRYSGGYTNVADAVLPNSKHVFKLTHDATSIQLYLNTTDTVSDNDINPYIYKFGVLKEDVEKEKIIISEHSTNLDSINKLDEYQFGTYKDTWTRIENTATRTIYRDTIDTIQQGTPFSFIIETIATNITKYDLIVYDSENNYKTYENLLINKYNEFSMPFNCVKIQINITTTTEFVPSTSKIIMNLFGNINSKVFNNAEKLNHLSKNSLYESKILIMGDSISADYYQNYKKWVTDLIEENILDTSKVSNNSIHATGFVATYNSENNNFNDRIVNVSNKNTYDMVITFGGINDFIQNIPWNTFTSAVDTYMSYLVNNFTQAKLVILTPLRTYNTNVNSVGKYQQDYSNYIKEKAQYYSLPVYDLTNESGFCPYIDSFKTMWTLVPPGYEAPDGTHPTATYHKKYLAPMIKGFIENLIYKE